MAQFLLLFYRMQTHKALTINSPRFLKNLPKASNFETNNEFIKNDTRLTVQKQTVETTDDVRGEVEHMMAPSFRRRCGSGRPKRTI